MSTILILVIASIYLELDCIYMTIQVICLAKIKEMPLAWLKLAGDEGQHIESLHL